MRNLLTASVLFLSFSIAAVAHAAVENTAVQARMDAMKAIGGAMKTLGNMAKGSVDFDATAAEAAVDVVAVQSAMLPTLFEAQETDPMSEAKPEIWTNWDDFVAKANAMTAAAEAVSIVDAGSIGAAMEAIGGSCKGCHSEYRM
ncbi:c-type cytochrome [Pacificibacter marinus]|uniref:Cytochrome c-556 n=1 Tax=Pacificibacter marinus TaxID=658057 RepID=A0A1Y5S6M3_9RHOB|nr:cytochrome c [Pacificibacter marinus]SEK92131.1 Cytochrome c556 [Pacificibacter marinus]SLN31328.1 Cytochrome c-556 [Pacificibacter marinus]